MPKGVSVPEYLLFYYKSTPETRRWDTHTTFNGTTFCCYVSKWRTPVRRIPRIIRLSLFFPPHLPELGKPLRPSSVALNHDLRRLPIITIAHRFSEHTETVRYDPIGSRKEWEIRSLYVPKSILPDPSIDTIGICVEWLAPFDMKDTSALTNR